jgi:hypothetical protein
MSALKHIQPAALPAVPSAGAWLQAAAQQTSHAVSLVFSAAASKPQALVWLVAGIVVLQVLLWVAMRLLGHVLRVAWSVLAWLGRAITGKSSSEPGRDTPEPRVPDDSNGEPSARPPSPTPAPGHTSQPTGPEHSADEEMTRQVSPQPPIVAAPQLPAVISGHRYLVQQMHGTV